MVLLGFDSTQNNSSTFFAVCPKPVHGAIVLLELSTNFSSRENKMICMCRLDRSEQSGRTVHLYFCRLFVFQPTNTWATTVHNCNWMYRVTPRDIFNQSLLHITDNKYSVRPTHCTRCCAEQQNSHLSYLSSVCIRVV